jgi:type IV pilus modification protein PilV
MNRRSAGGFTLIELLVALLIFSVAIIGYAALNNRLALSQWSQQQRSLAQQAVQMMVERVKANPAARGCYPLLAVQSSASDRLSSGELLDCQAYGTLSSQAVAVADMSDWLLLLAGQRQKIAGQPLALLPDAVGCIEELVVERRYQISVVWPVITGGGAAPSGCMPAGDDGERYLSESAVIDFAELAQ